MAPIIKGVLNREEAVDSLAVARQPLQNYSMQASGGVLLGGGAIGHVRVFIVITREWIYRFA